MTRRRSLLAALWLCAWLPATARAQEGHGHHGHGHDDSGLGDVAADMLESDRKLREAEGRARKLTERWTRQTQGQDPGSAAELLDEEALGQMLAETPGGPAELDDLKREAAEERAQLGFEAIDVAVAEKAQGTQGLYRQYLIQVFFYGNRGNMLGQFIHRGLTTIGGWRAFPTMDYKSLPENIAGLYSGGHVNIDPVKGNNTLVVSHEWWHHMGKPDPRPDSAYDWMGKEFGGGNGLPPPEEEEDFYAFQCGF